MNHILNIECADGEKLPYDGFIEIEISASGLPTSQKQLCLALIVPASNYNTRVPLLLGTNVLSQFLDLYTKSYGNKLLQTAGLHTPWYLCFRSMLHRDKELKRRDHVLGIVKSAENKNITLLPNTTKTIAGFVDKGLNYPTTCALLQPTLNSVITDDLDLCPSLITYQGTGKGFIDVTISNCSTRTVTIPPKSIVCEIQPVKIEDEVKVPNPTQRSQHETNILNDVKISSDSLSQEKQTELENLLLKYKDVFSQGDTDIGHYQGIQHKIELTDETPIKQRFRRIPPAMYEEVREHLKQLAACGVIRPSHSPWSSPVVLARRKDGKIRMCVDYRALNNKTIKDSYALPRIDEVLDSLAGAKYFSVVDMKSGYYQVEIAEPHKSRTAFTVGPLGFWEHNRLPFGLSNAPATYQRIMENCFGELHLKICFIYLDDLIIFSDTFEEHLERLELILLRLRECGLKLSAKKCSFLQQKVKYIGHIVSSDGIETDPDKIDKIVNWPTPKSAEDIRQFLGFCGYYRRFCKNFSQIARPLSELMPKPEKCRKRKRKNSNSSDLSSNFKWGPEQQRAFEKLKHMLSSPPVLAYPNYNEPFELHTDASQQGLGAVLYQTQEGQKRVVSYASRALNKSERHYPAHKLEYLALKWAICDKFYEYLYGRKFTVVTDNNPLTYVLTTAKLDACGHRWLASLSSFDFNIVYRPGKSNVDADTLSRYPGLETCPDDTCELNNDSIQAICNGVHCQPYIETLTMSETVLPSDDIVGQDLSQYSQSEIRKAQRDDPHLKFWLNAVWNRQKPKLEKFSNSPYHVAMLRSFDKLKICRGILYREVVINEETRLQLILPNNFIHQVLTSLHNDVGHPGRDRTLSLLRDRFYWPCMSSDVEDWIKNCGRCVRFKTIITAKAPLVNIQTSEPLELVCLDYLTLDMAKSGIQYVLIITDHFTRYAQAIPTRNMSAKTTADAFLNNFVKHYGLPKRIHSDQGANFESKLIKEVLSVTNISKSRTTPYHPMGNGMCERFNRTLIDMLGTLESEKKSDWTAHISTLVYAYNSTRHDSTGHSPFYLMFGRDARLPIDITFGLNENQQKQSLSKYAKDLGARFKQAHEKAQEVIKKSQENQKKNYDTRIRGASIQVGDRVLVKNMAFDGRHKLYDKWSEEIYIVTNHINNDIPVFEIKPENGQGKKRVLHRNMLLPIGTLDENQEQSDIPKVKPKPLPRKKKPSQITETTEVKRYDVRDVSDDEEYVYIPSNMSDFRNSDMVNEAGTVSQHPSDDLGSVVETQNADHGGDAHNLGGAENDSGSGDVEQNAETGVDTPVQDDIQHNVETNTEENTPDTNVSDETVALRRSTRPSRKPNWMQSNEYVMSQTVSEWEKKVNVLMALTDRVTSETISLKIYDAILSVILNK